ncbi:MAG TPA: mercuric transporter MerT family protein [Pyrinomonadaceae bacterium]|nr:mercuric transporter MerT family protein [Pyrinomonadaceae bacterium]
MKKERLAAGGAVLAAGAASVCCLGPLLFVALGLGSFGAATMFEPARPYLLGAAVLFLAFGFYRAYFRREAAFSASCEPGEACATRPAGRAGRAALWVAAIAVLAFALSPYYAGALARRLSARPAAPSSATQPATARVTFKVSGMTCAGCEATIRLALEKTAGVRSAEVSYDRGEAVVEYDPAATTPEKLRDAISETGYPAELKK